MEKRNLCVGIDVSTQSSKLVLIDLDNSKIVYTYSVVYDIDLPDYNTENGTRKTVENGVSESDPKMWIDAIEQTFNNLSNLHPELIKHIKCISVSGQQHGLVTIDKNGELSRPYSKLWNDFSTMEECQILTEKIGGADLMVKLIANTQKTGYTAPKILNMVRHEPEIYENTKTVFLVHNFINWWLTGGVDGGISAMEPGDASGSALWDPITKQWVRELIEAISPDLINKLPPVMDSREPLGTIGSEFVEKYGFSENCLIASGSGDNMMAAIGTGNYKKGVVTISLGTSGTAYTILDEPFVDESGEIALFCDALGNYLPLLCISNLANGFETILKQYNMSYEEFEEIIIKTPSGNHGKLLIPWFEGERTPDIPDAVPIYFGFQLTDFTKEILCRAVLEGHVMSIYQGFLKLPVKPKEILLTGGISKSHSWRETIANVFNCDVVQVLGEGAALGAALHAAWTFYQGKSMEEIAKPFIKLDEQGRIKPDPEKVALYNEFSKLYYSVSKRIRGLPGGDCFSLFKEFR
jgi:xylulokinase